MGLSLILIILRKVIPKNSFNFQACIIIRPKTVPCFFKLEYPLSLKLFGEVSFIPKPLTENSKKLYLSSVFQQKNAGARSKQ